MKQDTITLGDVPEMIKDPHEISDQSLRARMIIHVNKVTLYIDQTITLNWIKITKGFLNQNGKWNHIRFFIFFLLLTESKLLCENTI